MQRWRLNNLDKRRIYNRARRARKLANHGSSISSDVLRERQLLFDNSCAYCGSTTDLGVDHVIAISRGGPDVPLNCIPCCARCNSSKSNRNVKEWYESQPFFSDKRWRLIVRACNLKGNQLQIC